VRSGSWNGTADAVFRGGGVQGLALIGALEGFASHERWPFDSWINVAGTSAGAVLACYIAYDRRPGVGRRMLDVLDPERLGSFGDFPYGRKYVGGLPRLFARRGMASGRSFEAWLDGVLEHSTFDLVRPDDGTDDWTRARLKLIACDATNRRLLVLPEDLPRYRLPGSRAPIDPASFPIAKAVRMSTSIPFIFEPVELERITDDAGGRVPPTPASIVDGGILSNFPVWLFDTPEPRRPTFGFTIDGGAVVGAGFARIGRSLPWPLRFGLDILHTAQDAWDARFVSRSTSVRTVTVSATVRNPDGTPYAVRSTEFDVSDAAQAQLIENGRAAATRFLDAFDPAAHVNTFNAHVPMID